MEIVSWILITLNVTGAAIMVRFGLPPEVPFLGRRDADPILGYLGLLLFGTSVATRIALAITD